MLGTLKDRGRVMIVMDCGMLPAPAAEITLRQRAFAPTVICGIILHTVTYTFRLVEFCPHG
jgi:hypothetical protein